MTSTDAQIEYGPKELSFEIWKDYAKTGNVADLDESLTHKFGLIQPEVFSSLTDSPVDYAENLRDYFVNKYKLGEDKFRDVYVTRRIAMGLAEAKKNFEAKNKDFTQDSEFENGIMRGFHIIAENYSNVKKGEAKYFEDFADPDLFLAIFGPVMEVLPEAKIEKVLNTVTNQGNKNLIMGAYKVRANKGTN